MLSKLPADEEERRIREQARVAAEWEWKRNQAIMAAIEQESEKEKQRQNELRQFGPCPSGYTWIQQIGGYGYAGGSHWLNDAMLGT